MKYIIECHDWWFADWKEGDPPRTLLKENAKVFSTYEKAQLYLNKMIKRNPHRDLNGARIILLESAEAN